MTRTSLPTYRGTGWLGSLGDFHQRALETLAHTATMGDLVELQVALPGVRALVMHTPQMVEHVLVENARAYGKITRSYLLLRKLLGMGLLTSDGSFWLRQRRLMQPAFHKERLRGFGERMVQATVERLPRLQRSEPYDLSEEMMALALRIVGETLFTADVTAKTQAVSVALTELLEQVIWRATHLYPFPDAVPTPKNLRYKRARAALNEVVYGIIAERRARTSAGGGTGEDLLGMLLDVTDADTGEQMTDEQVRDEVMTLLLAGHETTANTLSWSTYLLLNHPEANAKLRAELDATLQGRLPTAADLPALPYLSAVIHESLRLYPPVWMVGRGLLQDDLVGGVPLKKGTFVFFSPWLLHRREQEWSEPLRFLPERWMTKEPARRPKCSFVPFSTGPRKCIGDGFALQEAMLVLATMWPRTNLQRVSSAPVEPEPLLTLRPRGGMWVRNQPQ